MLPLLQKPLIMKNLFIFLFISSVCFSQTGEYGQLKKNKEYQKYISKDGTVLKIGDIIHINTINDDHYNYIAQGNAPGGTILANKDIRISRLKAWSYKKQPPHILVGFKGYGMMVNIAYETALEVGEIYNPNGVINKTEALAILKEKKELLDLELITQSDYDKIKADLSKIILSEN